MIHSFKYSSKKIGDIGVVEEINNSIVMIAGFKSGAVGESITFESGEHGRILSLDKGKVKVIVYSRRPIKPGTKAVRTGNQLRVSVGEGILGHVINSLGYTLREKRERSDEPEPRDVEAFPIGISGRKKINKFMHTGVNVIDLMVPIGEGQRELAVGDRKTGKSHFCLQTVLSQARAGKICIYALIGKRKSNIKMVEEFLEKEKVMDKCILVASSSYDSPGEIFLTPYTAMAIAEYFRDKGESVLVILDDLTTHAKYYRELALLEGRFPGRESYPGDIFHVHSRLLERAGNFAINDKETSITCIPLAETLDGDLTGYIQTNLMSMTDGHIYFDSELFFKGMRPAVNVFLSVTRVGKQTQSPLRRDINSEILLLLKKHEEMQRFLKFGSELTENVRETLAIGDKILKFFNQTNYETIYPDVQSVLISLIWLGVWDGEGSEKLAKAFNTDPKTRAAIEKAVSQATSLEELNKLVSKKKQIFNKILKKNNKKSKNIKKSEKKENNDENKSEIKSEKENNEKDINNEKDKK